MQNPPLELLKYRAFPDIANALRARREKLLHRWEGLVTQVLPAAEELTLAQLRDHLPTLLSQIAEALEADEPAATYDLLDISRPHGETRFHQHFDVNELLIEYHLLRRIVVEEIADELSRDLDICEVVAINQSLDTAQRRGVVTFVEHQSNKLRSATELQSQYLSFLSHDLRGGLNGVLLMIEVLRREMAVVPQFAQTIEDLEIMRRSILDTVGTMDRFLHAERFRKGGVEVKLAPVDLAKLMSELSTQFIYIAREKGVELRTDVPAGTIVSDRELLTLVLQNLLQNAVKYTRKGAVSVNVREQKVSGAAGCRISIIDQGPGIAPEKLADLFKPFTRGDTHGEGGVGLGLSIAKQAADLLGAVITVESKIGEGTTFKVDVPNRQSKP